MLFVLSKLKRLVIGWLFVDVILKGGHIVQPEERQKQVENLINTVKTTAAYSSGLDWECLVSDVDICSLKFGGKKLYYTQDSI